MSNKTPLAPTFPDAMENFRKSIGYRLYCHLPGEIVSFDRATMTASVKVGFKQVVPDYAAETGSKIVPYPQLSNVPVFTLQGSGGSIGADPRAGDPCLIAVGDRNIDAWFQNGGQQAPLSPRAHDLSDAFVFVGFNPLPKPVVSARLAGECGIADALAKVVVKNGKVDISTAAGTTNLLTILTTLLTAQDALFTALAADGALSGATHTAATAAATAGAAASTALGALLY